VEPFLEPLYFLGRRGRRRRWRMKEMKEEEGGGERQAPN